MASSYLHRKQPARAIPPHLRFLDAVAHLETPQSPDPMNSGTPATVSAFAAKPFRAPARDFGSPYKSSSKNIKRPRSETVRGSRRQKQKQKQKTVRLNCPSPALPTSDSGLDGLIGGMERLTLADDPIQASLPAKEGFNVSIAAAPPPRSSSFPQSIAAPINYEADKEDVAAVPGHDLHSRSPHYPEGTPLRNVASASSPPFRPMHTIPFRHSNVPAPATDSSSASRPYLTAITLSLVYEVFACPDDEADEVQTWYPIGGGALDVAATGRGLILGATVEV